MTAVAASGFTFVVVLCSRLFGPAGRPAGPTNREHSMIVTTTTKVKPEAATAVIELLMMGGKTPETC
jgi:hypothetical protein